MNDFFVILLSDSISSEYRDVIVRKKFKGKYKPEIAELFIGSIAKKALNIMIKSITINYKDPKDNMLLELAIHGKADCIVTGDKLVLELQTNQNIPI